MKHPLLLLSIIFVFSSCSNSKKEMPDAERVITDTVAQINHIDFGQIPIAENIHAHVFPKYENLPRLQDVSIRKFLSEIKNPMQIFIVNACEGGEITGEKRTRITFSPNSFVTQNGEEVLSDVQIGLKECYSVGEMLLENLTTTSDSNILESKGMIYVNVTYRGEELKLREGEEMNVEFPFSISKSDGFTFFYGERKADDKLNWKLVDANEQLRPFAVASSNKKKQLIKPGFSYNGLDVKDYLISQLDYPDAAKRNELSANVEVSLMIDPTGRVAGGWSSSPYKIFRDAVDSVINKMPLWTPASFGEENCSSLVKLDIDFNIRKQKQISVSYNPSSATVVTNNQRFYCGSGNIFTDRVFNKSFNKLGWINCDRFLKFPSSKSDVIVQADSKSDVKIVFKKMKSVLGGEACLGYTRFPNIPEGYEVVVVALRYEEGNIFYAIKPMTTEKQNVVSLAWKKGNEEEVTRALRTVL